VNRRCVLIGVEGNHDQAFLQRIFCKLLGFSKWDENPETLDHIWNKFIPQYPTKKRKYYARLDMPSILHKEDVAIAIYVGEGSNLIQNLRDKLSDIDPDSFAAFAIIADADKNSPDEIAKIYQDGLKEYFPYFPIELGTTVKGSTNLGIYILPNNSDKGVLDTLLCKCGEMAYPIHMARAKTYINQFSDEEIKHWKPFDRQKAIVAAITSILKPGKTSTVSISDGKWISNDTAERIPEISALLDFLTDLIDL